MGDRTLCVCVCVCVCVGGGGGGGVGLFWALFTHFSKNENFPEILGSVTFEHLWTPNFMQNIRKN